MKKELGVELVIKICELLHYDENTGLFRWKERPSCRAKVGWFPGSKAGVKGYVGFKIFHERYYSHRLAWAMYNGELSSKHEIDHINGNKSDNRIENLRIASSSQNQHNKPNYRNNKSGVKGVNLDGKTGKWRAKYNMNGIRYELGLFPSLIDAKSAVMLARSNAHGDFANHGVLE